MMWIGDTFVLLCAVIALCIGIWLLLTKKTAMHFQLVVVAVVCHALSCAFDTCETLITGTLSDGFTIGYLGSIGCFLFLLTVNYAYMDGILDDGSASARRTRLLALLAPLGSLIVLIPNVLAEIPLSTKICYVLIWIPAIFSAYFHLKHALLPDMGFGFVKAIRPFNIAALVFTFCQFLHLTVWNLGGWIATTLTGILFGISSIVMVIMAKKGVEQWIL